MNTPAGIGSVESVNWHTRVTRAQEGMLAVEGPLTGKPSPFHLLVSAEIAGRVDLSRLKAVLARATRRNTALRTVFSRDADTGELGCRVLSSWQPVIVEQDLPSLPPTADRIEVLHRLLGPVAPQLLRPYDQPPVAFVLTHAGPERLFLSILAHHTVLDGASVGLLWHEIITAYAAEHGDGGDGDPVPGMEIIAEAEHAALSRDRVPRRAEMLAGWPTAVELPSDLERPETRTFSGLRLPFALTPEAKSGCDSLASSLKVSRNTVLLAAWALVVARRGALRRLIVGVPTIGRSSAAAMQVIGGPTGLGAVACEIPVDGSVAEYVRQTSRATQQALAFGSVPFEDLVAALSAGGDPSRNPLAQIAFGDRSEVVRPVLTAGDITFDVRVGHTGGTAYDAMITALGWGTVATLELEYATSVLSSQQATDLVGSFDRALVEMASAPDGPLALVTTITEAQQRRLEALQSAPAVDTTSATGLWQLIEEAADRCPEAIAIRDADPNRTVDFRRLVAAAATQSARLADAGVGEGDCVAVAVRRSAEEIIAVLGILRAGAAYVAIDADDPPAVTAEILDRAGVRVIVGDPERLARLGAEGERCVRLPVVTPESPVGDVSIPSPAAADPERVACVTVTYGSDGRLKSTLIPCRAVLRLAHHPDYLSQGSSMRFLRQSTLAGQASLLEVFAPLLAGRTVEIYPDDVITPDALAIFLQARSITGLWLSADLFCQVADSRPDAFRTVGQLLTGADALPPAQVVRVLRSSPGLRVTCGYGSPENTLFTTVYHVDDPTAANAATLPLGKPVQGTGVLVLDSSGRPVPPGGIGELFVHGDGLALGYAGMPAETAEVFGAFAPDTGHRLHRTGDMVRWDANGDLRLVARRDRQVEIRGFRVDLDQVAGVLRRHPDVRDAVVDVEPEDDGGLRIVAAITPLMGAASLTGSATVTDSVLPATLRSFAAQRLPGHALPQVWTVVGEIPSGLELGAETDTRSDTEGDTEKNAETDVIIGDDIEDVIADAWRKVLGHRDFCHSDWFLDVGGDSLLMIRVQAILHRTLPDWDITVADLYACATIDDLAAKLRAESGVRLNSSIPMHSVTTRNEERV